MNKIGILAAMPVEFENLIRILNAREISETEFTKIYECKYNSMVIILACSGIGKVNAAACTQMLIDLYKVEAVINIGIAGAIAQGLNTLDVVVGREVTYHDFMPAELLKRYYPFRNTFECDKRFVEIAEKACASYLKLGQYTTGLIATGDCFVEDKSTKNYIRTQLNAVCCEMEGVAVGHTCYINEIPFLVLPSISDLADDGAQMSYNEFEKKAALQANNIVIGMLDQLEKL